MWFVAVAALMAGCRLGFDVLPGSGDSGTGDGNDGGPQACIVDITARARHACAVRSDGTLWCSGFNLYGQLGNGMTVDTPTPQLAIGLPPIRSVTAGVAQTYVLARDGSVWAFGRNVRYALGDGTLTDRTQPFRVPNLPAVSDEIVAGESHACVLASGDVYCWGWNIGGQVGDGTTTDRPTAVRVFSGAVHIAAGGRNTCALDATKSVHCWGNNFQGQVGIGNINDPQPFPVLIPQFTAEEISVGGRVACARRSDGTVWCWGRNWTGILADGTTTDRATPVQIPGVSNAVGLVRALGGRRMCAITGDGSVWCWGETMYGMLSSTATLLAPVPPAPIADFAGATMLTALSGFTCMRTAAGTFACAGNNETGELGDGTTTSRTTVAPALITCP